MTVGVCEDDFIFRSELLFLAIIPSTPQRSHEARARGRMSPCCRHAALPNLSNTKKHCNPKESHLPVITFVYIYFYFMRLDVFLQVYVCTMYVQDCGGQKRALHWGQRCCEPHVGAENQSKVLGYSARATRLLTPDPSLQTLQFQLFKVIL